MKNNGHSFLYGGGEMGELTRNYDWSKTPIGSPAQWPQSLRTTVSILLNSQFPMFVWWGNELTTIYNDSYKIIAGDKHPHLLGKSGQEAWSEIWDDLSPLVDKVFRGIPTWSEDLVLNIKRRGFIEETYFTFSYSPVLDESGAIGGLFCACIETTEKVVGKKKLAESEARFRNMVKQAPVAITLTEGEDIVIESINSSMLEIMGKENEEEVVGKKMVDVLPEIKDQTALALARNVFVTGEPFRGNEVPVMLNIKGHPRQGYFNISYTPLIEEGKVTGVLHVAVDVTEQVIARSKLEESRGLLFSIFEQAPVAISIVRSHDLIVELANPFQLQLLGRSAREVVGRPLFEGIPEAEKQGFRDMLTNIMDTGEPLELRGHPVNINYKGELTLRYFDLYYHPLREPDGAITGVVTITVEVTDTVLARQAAEKSEQQTRSFIESAAFPISVLTGKERRIQFANRAILDAWGKGNDVIGKSVREVLPELSEEIFEQSDAVYTTGIAFHAENQQIDVVVNGKIKRRYYNYSYTPLFDTESKVYGIISTASDVTDLNLAHKKIEESEKSLRNMILQAPVAMCIFRGPEYIIEIANEQMFQIWGRSPEEMLHKPMFEALPDVKDQGFEASLYKVYTTGESIAASGVPGTFVRHGVKVTIYLDYVFQALREADGRVSGLMIVGTDVTEQVIARQHIEAVVTERTKELAEANRQLQHNNKELQQFAYIASHDLQEPVRKITTFSQMLEKSLGTVDARSKNYLNKIASSSERMLNLIRDVLTFSELSYEREKFKQIDLVEVLQNIISDFELLIEEKQAIINYTMLPVITAIPIQMNQLFTNLISNALKFSKKDVPPVINITSGILSKEQLSKHPELDQSIDYYDIRFSDNGIGFDQQNADKIFDIFQRLHGKAEYEGTGIGLALCKKIAINHKGNLIATSILHQGATFNILLPKKQSEVVY
jgi:PAS domain S-box-containing protein